jgi:3-(3-hydroxy-phenyl)propionate hydroxylase
MNRHEVVIAGAGPTGLMLASELALAGVDVAIAERRTGQDVDGSRAGGLHARSVEMLDQRGIAERFVSQGVCYPAVHWHQIPLTLSDCPSRHNYVLGLRQQQIERLLAERVGEQAVTIYRGRNLTGFAQGEDGVSVTLADGAKLHAAYLVGCDGGRSTVRKAAGIAFAGWEATTSWLIAEAQLAREPRWGFHQDGAGIHAIGKLGDDGSARVVLTERQLRLDPEPALSEVSAALLEVYGTDYGIHSPQWLSRFTDLARQAVTYRDRRVLLAGDAAHVHAPVGGQGLNIGMQDALNLGWKLGQVLQHAAPDSLLDTYHAERHPVAARALRVTMAQVALRRTDAHSKALSALVGEFLAPDETRQRLAAEIAGLHLRYDLGEGHPLLGRRMPDLDLLTAEGPRRLFGLLHGGRPLLLNLGAPGSIGIAAWAARVALVEATCAGIWELPVLGAVAAPSAVLIRPDGYVAWAETSGRQGLEAALLRWCGPA